MKEHVVYNEENAKWHKADADFTVRDSSARGPATLVQEVQADGYRDAFEQLYGHAPVIPAPVRAPRRESILDI